MLKDGDLWRRVIAFETLVHSRLPLIASGWSRVAIQMLINLLMRCHCGDYFCVRLEILWITICEFFFFRRRSLVFRHWRVIGSEFVMKRSGEVGFLRKAVAVDGHPPSWVSHVMTHLTIELTELWRKKFSARSTETISIQLKLSVQRI